MLRRWLSSYEYGRAPWVVASSNSWLVPLAGDHALFTHSPYAGPRYLIVAKTATNALEGSLLEVLLRRTAAPIDTLALFTGLYRNYRSGHLDLVWGKVISFFTLRTIATKQGQLGYQPLCTGKAV
jgi:hypothetical protein